MLKILRKKAIFVIAIAGAAIIGGSTTVLVSAAIPSTADGKISGCYRNNASLTDAKGALRVVDKQAGQNCNTGETAIDWSSNSNNGSVGQVAYTYIEPGLDSEGAQTNGPATIDIQHTKNIISAYYTAPTGDTPDSAGGYCITANFEPKNIQVTPRNANIYVEGYGIVSVKSAASGWSKTDGNPERLCATYPSANVFIGNGGNASNNQWYVHVES